MRKLWKLAIVAVAVLALGGAIGGIVVAQTDSDPARPVSNFLSRLAENLGITEAKLQEAIDKTSVDIVDEKEAAGDLTTEQANRLRDRIASGEGFFGGFGHGRIFGEGFGFGKRFDFSHGFGFGAGLGFFGGFGHPGAGLDEQAACLGVATADDLKTAFADGQSLAEIGAANGKSRDDVKACVTAPLEEWLTQAVADGKLDQAMADKISQRLTERLDDLIDGTSMGKGMRGFSFDWGDGSSFPWGGFFRSGGTTADPASTTY